MGNQEPGLMMSSCWDVLFIVCFLFLFCFGCFFPAQLQFNHLSNDRKKDRRRFYDGCEKGFNSGHKYSSGTFVNITNHAMKESTSEIQPSLTTGLLF